MADTDDVQELLQALRKQRSWTDGKASFAKQAGPFTSSQQGTFGQPINPAEVQTHGFEGHYFQQTLAGGAGRDLHTRLNSSRNQVFVSNSSAADNGGGGSRMESFQTATTGNSNLTDIGTGTQGRNIGEGTPHPLGIGGPEGGGAFGTLARTTAWVHGSGSESDYVGAEPGRTAHIPHPISGAFIRTTIQMPEEGGSGTSGMRANPFAQSSNG